MMNTSELGLAEDPFAGNQEKAEPHYINPDDLTPKNWKSSDGMYPDRRGGFNSQDRTLWRKDRYNAVYGRYRDKNGEYRDKNGHKLGDDNVTLLSFNNDKPFPGWANKPGSQFHPDDHPKVDADFYRNRENWPAKGLRSLALHPFEDDWNENGVPLKNEFHDLSALPAFNGLNPKQLPDRVDMDKVFELQQQAIQDQAYAARQQPNQTANTIQQIGNIVQTAAPLVAQGVSALAGVVSSKDNTGNLSNQLADTMHRVPEAGRNGVFYEGEFDPALNSTPGFGKPTWEPDLERNAQTLEHRPGDNAGVVRMQNMLAEHEPFGRERVEAVPLAVQGGDVSGSEITGPVSGPNLGDLTGESYGDGVQPEHRRGNGTQLPPSSTQHAREMERYASDKYPGYSGKNTGADSEHARVDKELLKEWVKEIYKDNPDGLEGWDFDKINYGQWLGSGRYGKNVQGMLSSQQMALEWATGTGPKHRIHGPGSVEVENMKNAPSVNGAGEWALNKVKKGINEPTTSYRGGFGPGKSSGPIKAGFDPTEQYVGSYRVDVVPDAKNENLTFIVTNPTSFKSFSYGLGPDWNRHETIPTPMGNTRQIYTWTERVKN